MSITLEPQELAILDRFASASGTPRATIIRDLIRTVVPELDRAAELIELANAAPRHIKQGLVNDLSNATADAMGFLQPFQSEYHMVMNRLQAELPLQEAKKASGRAGAATRQRRSPGGPDDPLLLTGGSKS
jgi:predicted DNA-binding protein